jgi:Na+-translocating ferredoxin:NAD+ oxidoreductase RnfE subunit
MSTFKRNVKQDILQNHPKTKVEQITPPTAIFPPTTKKDLNLVLAIILVLVVAVVPVSTTKSIVKKHVHVLLYMSRQNITNKGLSTTMAGMFM